MCYRYGRRFVRPIDSEQNQLFEIRMNHRRLCRSPSPILLELAVPKLFVPGAVEMSRSLLNYVGPTLPE